MAGSDRVYGLSEKYLQRLKKDTILNLLITLMFYMVFNVLFRDHSRYGIIRVAFVFLFLAIAAAAVVLGRRRSRRAAAMHYAVEKDALEYCDGKKTVRYPWHHFEKVVVNPNRMSLPYPFEFYTKEGMFVIHRQLGEPEKLIPAILKRIKPYAAMDEGTPEEIHPNDNWMKDLGRIL